MIDSKLLSVSDGVILDVFIPEVYDDKTKEYLEDYEVKYIGFKVKTGNNIITLIKEDSNNYSNIFVNDKVKLEKYGYLYTYSGYLDKLTEMIDIYNLSYTSKEKDQIFKKNVISEEEFNRKPYYIIDYEFKKSL